MALDAFCLQQTIDPKTIKARLLNGHDPNWRTQLLGGLVLQPAQELEQATMVTALDLMFRHLVAAWRKRRQQPGRTAEFQ